MVFDFSKQHLYLASQSAGQVEIKMAQIFSDIEIIPIQPKIFHISQKA